METAGSVGYSSSLVFDNQNRPTIACVDRINFRLRLARRQSLGGDFEVTMQFRSAFLYCLLLAVPATAAWNLDTVAWNAVAPREASPKVKVAYRRVLGPGPGGSIVSRDSIAVAFEDTFASRVKVATKLGDSPWDITQFEAGSFAPDIAMDSLGGIHLAYVRPQAPGVSNLVYAKKAAGGTTCGANNSYQCEPVPYQGLGGCASQTSNPMPSIVIDASGTPRMAAKDCVAAVVLTRQSGAWQEVPTNTSQCCEPVLEQLHLRLKSDGWNYVFHIRAPDGGNLTWSVGKPDGNWYHQPPDLFVGFDSVYSVAVDAQDLPQICYTGPSPVSSSVLRYASRGQLDWNVSTVWSDHASDCSIAIRGDGKPGISFHDGYTSGLYYAETVGSLWSKEPVETAGNVGYRSSLVFDNQNRPIIAYVDRTNFRIRLARRQ